MQPTSRLSISKRWMSPTTAAKVVAQTRLTPATVTRRLIDLEKSASLASSDSSAAIACAEPASPSRGPRHSLFVALGGIDAGGLPSGRGSG